MRRILYAIIGLYISIVLLLNIPYVQQRMSVLVANELQSILKSEVSIGQIDMGMLNRIIINDLQVEDLSGKEMIKVSRLSAKFDILPLFRGKVSISNVQLFGFNVNLEKPSPAQKMNIQFLIDAFASKDTIQKDINLDLRINSLLIRRGKVRYDVLSENETPGKFNPNHLHLQDIIANISLKALQKDSINAAIKRMSIEETNSGLKLKKLSFKAVGNESMARIDNFSINLSSTVLEMDTITIAYDSLKAFNEFTQKARFSLRTKPTSKIVLQDLSPLVPAFANFKDPISLNIQADGTLNSLNCPVFYLSTGKAFNLRGDVSFQDLLIPNGAYVFGNLSKLYINQHGFEFLFRNLIKSYDTLPPVVQNLGTLTFNGQVSGYFTDLVTYGQLRTDVGSIKTDLMLTPDKAKGILSYSGNVNTVDFDLNKLLSNNKLGKTTFNLHIDGKHGANQYPNINLKGLIASVGYSDYVYENITLDGAYTDGGFLGKLFLDDPNVSLLLNGLINTNTDVPTFNFYAHLNRFRPHALNLTPDYEDTNISVKFKADFTGATIDDMNGEINVDSLEYISPEKEYRLENFKIKAMHIDKRRKNIQITSNFLRGNIDGDFSYRTLPISVQNIMHRYLPALIERNEVEKTKNNFNFSLQIENTDLIHDIFHIPLKIYSNSMLKGHIHDVAGDIHLEGYFPRLLYKNDFIESATLLCENKDDHLNVNVRLNNRKEKDAFNLAIEAQAKDDKLNTKFYFGNSKEVTYGGNLAAQACFVRETDENHDGAKKQPRRQHRKAIKAKRGALKTVIDVQPTEIILSDTIWKIHPSQVLVDSGKVHVNNFCFSHQDKRYLRINGTISKELQDTVRLDLKDINMAYIFDIANLGVTFQGEASGPAYGMGVLSKPFMQTDLSIRNFGIFGGHLGDANIHGEWHHDVKGILLDARIKEKDIAKTHVNGYIYPIKPTSALDLHIDADGTNLEFIQEFVGSITPEFKGRVKGNVHLYGKFKGLTMQGKVLGDASMKIEILNTTFNVKDSILVEPEGLTFNNNRFYDENGREGRISGALRYKHFKDINYQFDFNFDNLLLMNTKESPDYPFFGTVYGTGNVNLYGNAQEGANINIALSTNRNSVFTYILDNVTTAASNQFIRFVDKTPRRVLKDSVHLSFFEQVQHELKQQEIESDNDLRLNIQLDVTPDATMRIIMDPTTGDHIAGNGSGNLRAEFYNKGDFKLFGNYKLNQGVYKFSLQEVIRKDFNIRDGSTISFTGVPGDAVLDIQAAYAVNSASLNDLMPNASEYVNQTNVKVNCTMGISGQLTSPTIKLGIELPNERDEVQALVRNYIPTDEQMNMQILYLLGIGKFYTPENVGITQNSNMMSSVLSSTLSGQLNNALSQIINNNNWNLGTNFSTGEKGWSDIEFAGMLSGQLLNNRLLINGNFGYRENPMANTNFVGDFEAEWLITRSGDIRLRAYNATNDRYYTRTNLTTQGIGIIFQKEFNKWKELMFWNKWKLRRLEKKPKNTTTKAEQQPQESENATSLPPARAREKRKK